MGLKARNKNKTKMFTVTKPSGTQPLRAFANNEIIKEIVLAYTAALFRLLLDHPKNNVNHNAITINIPDQPLVTELAYVKTC